LDRLGDVPRAIAARHALDEQAGGRGILPGNRFNGLWRFHFHA